MNPELFGLRHETWIVLGAIATIGTFIVALIAVLVAARQLQATNATRLDQNRPYVMVTIESGLAWFQLLDLVIENVGAGPARDVTISVTPPMKRSIAAADEPSMDAARMFREATPLMPPGYKLRTFFDDARTRFEKADEFPERFVFTLEYHDGHGHRFREEIVQDIGMLNDLEFSQVFGMHDATVALREIRDTLKRSPLHNSQAFEVVTETRESRVERLQRLRDAREAEREQRRSTNRDSSAQPADNSEPDGQNS